MAYTIHLRVDADLLGIARVIRLLRRYAVSAGDVAIERFSGREVANVSGTMTMGRSAEGLAAALLRAPDVLHAVICSESQVVVEFSRRLPSNGTP
jgi:acetolactate synthase regulatory subunit